MNDKQEYWCKTHGNKYLVMSHVRTVEDKDDYETGDFVTCVECDKSIEKRTNP